MKPRSEPLLWLQLLGLGAIPLELLLVLLLLAGSDPGPFPGIERLLTWGIGAVAPSVLLWRLPPDPLSLLVACTPVRLRTAGQASLIQQPMGQPLKLLLASGTTLLLPLLWWLDTTSVLASSYALLPTTNRVAALAAVMPLLTLMVWQWQQLVQASVLLSRDPQANEHVAEPESSSGAVNGQRLCLGLPWLNLPELAEEQANAIALPPPSEVAQALEESNEVQQEAPAEPGPNQEDPKGSPPDVETEALAAEVLKAPGESAAALEVTPENATEGNSTEDVSPQDHAAEELAAASGCEDSLGMAPELNQPAPPQERPSRQPVITDVEFTPLDATPYEEKPLESASVAIEPEETAEDADGPDLDPQV